MSWTTQQTTLQTALQTTQQVDLSGIALQIAELMKAEPAIKIQEIAERTGLTRDGVNYHIRKLRKSVGLRHEGQAQAGLWVFDAVARP